MTEHLPECLIPTDLNRGFWLYNTFTGLCICKELHACEQRVLEAAVQRVTRLYTSGDNYPDWPSSFMYVDTVIEAIKGDQP